MGRWLSLTVLKSSPSDKPRVLISVPKRAVKLAVRRNRLKRVLREAVRRDPFFNQERTYRLQVHEWPQNVDLKSAQKTLGALHA
jgi:ribonuclease P protein component